MIYSASKYFGPGSLTCVSGGLLQPTSLAGRGGVCTTRTISQPVLLHLHTRRTVYFLCVVLAVGGLVVLNIWGVPRTQKPPSASSLSMDHQNMDHGHHGNHDMANAIINTTLALTTMASQHDHASMNHNMHDNAAMNPEHDHAAMNHDHAAMNHDMSMSGHGMSMFFHSSSHSTILFEFWQTSTWAGMLGSCIAVFIMAALYEGLKVLREILLRRSNVRVRYNTMPIPTSEDAMVTEVHKSAEAKLCSMSHFIQTLLHILQVIISYFLMLIFMTYNVWLCISVAMGAGVGYFVFSWRRAIVVDINEHCH